MNLKDTIITTALLGTEKKQVNPAEFPDALKPSLEKVLEEDSDNETKFLRLAAIALNYIRAGAMPVNISIPISEAPEEEKAYCPDEAMSVLKELLSNKYQNLTWLWCKRCSNSNLIVQPELLPELFEWGVATKKQWAALFTSVIGKRGIWLSKFSDDWNFVNALEEETDWEIASLLQRLNFLETLRKHNPAEAREKIASVWKEENAAARLELLETLAINISRDDEDFLNQTLTDKSQKVKDKALQLLKLIPDSQLIQRYRQVLKDSFSLSANKVFGLISKTSIDVKLKHDEEIFRTGIQNLSSDKKISDENFILMQLISEVPPDFWVEHFGTDSAEVIKMLVSRDELKKFQSSLTNAVLKFRNKGWAKLIINHFDISSVSILPLLEDNEKIRYAEYLLKVYPNVNDIVTVLRNTSDTKEWNYNFTRQLLSVMAQDPYSYANLFESICIYFPAAVANDVDRFFPSEEWKRNYWQKISVQIKEFIRLKEKIKAIFSYEQPTSSTR